MRRCYSRLTIIKKAAESAAELTKQLLAFSRKQIIEPKVIDLNDLIERLHKMLVRMIGENIALRTVTHPGLFSIRVDPGQIEQIIMNLAVNARDAMPDGGILTLEAANVILDETYCQTHTNAKPGEHVMLAVSDTGYGMTAEVKTHLFEPFFTTKALGTGTGLGLATVYGAVTQNVGTIEVYSEPGQGTSFKIYFPRESQEVEVLVEDCLHGGYAYGIRNDPARGRQPPGSGIFAGRSRSSGIQGSVRRKRRGCPDICHAL